MQIVPAELVIQRIEAARARLGTASAPGALAFDGDGTLWSGDVGEDFFHALVERADLRPPADARLREDAREFGVALPATGGPVAVARALFGAYVAGTYPEERTCEMMTWACAGWRRDEVRGFVADLVRARGVATRVHPEARRVVDWARSEGLRVILVSASPREVVEAAGALVGFTPDRIVAATARYEADVMRAEVDRPIPYGPGKVAGLRRLLGDAPLLAAFGDNAFDVPMLGEAAVAVAIRPKDRLRARAAEVPGIVELLADR